MAHRIFDLAQQLTTSTGTGALTLGAVPSGCIGFADQGAVAGDTFWGCIRHLTANEVEVTLCTIVGDGTITRAATPLISTTGVKIAFSAGTKTISCVAPGSKSVVMDNNGDAAVTRDLAVGRNVVVAGTLAKANLVEAAGATTSLQIYNSGGAINGFGTSAGQFDFRSVANFAFWGGTGPTLLGGWTSAGLAVGHGTPAAKIHSVVADNGLGLLVAGVSKALRVTPQSGGIYLEGVDNTGVSTLQPLALGGSILYANANFVPGTDGLLTCGGAGNRWSVVYAATGTINTSGAASKMFIGDAIDAERRAARRILDIGPRRYKLAEAVEKKGDAARWHFGYVAEDVRDALIAEGLDPWVYGFMCRDRVLANERYTETESRPKTRKVKDYENVVEVRDGKPVRIRKAVERDDPVGTMRPVYDEGGAPVMVEVRNAQGALALAPMLHFVPEMEEVEVECVRQVDTGVDRLGLRYSELEAFLRCAA